jgi:hypothetical protein
MKRETHGMYKSTAYKRWIYMKARCARDPKYTRNGITVCDRWLHSFKNFYADMGDPPTARHTLDRVDGTKGYSPDNCRWATYKEQSRNLKSNVWIGDELMSDIAHRAGVHRNTVDYRRHQGLPLDEPSITERNTCKAGHEWTEANTYWAEVKTKQGGTRMQRFCRACRAQHQADLRARRSGLNSSHKGGLT